MNRFVLAFTAVIFGATLAGCGRLHVPAVLGGSSAQPAPGNRVNGTVQSVDGSKVTLQDGTSFTMDGATRVSRPVAVALGDLHSGDVVAVTATKQPDNTLLATIVNVFPGTQRPPLGQRPLDGGNLMTNATVDKVDSSGFSVTFPNGSAQVKLASDAKLTKIADGSAADVKTGVGLTALVSDGVARSVTVR
jgi:hypothetical protein